MEIRQIRATEGEALRSIRIQALSDTPSAFGSTIEATLAMTSEQWAARAAASATGITNVLYVAEDGGFWVGMAGGYLEEDEAEPFVELVSMWVHPAWRDKGLGRRLVERVVEWARRIGVTHVKLWVTENNENAATLYRRAGFEATGERQPLPSSPTLQEDRMSREV